MMQRAKARAWAKLPLRKRILVLSSFLALIAFLALAVASMIWPGFG